MTGRRTRKDRRRGGDSCSAVTVSPSAEEGAPSGDEVTPSGTDGRDGTDGDGGLGKGESGKSLDVSEEEGLEGLVESVS